MNIKEVSVKLLEVEVQLGVEENELSVEIQRWIFGFSSIEWLIGGALKSLECSSLEIFIYSLINIKEIRVKCVFIFNLQGWNWRKWVFFWSTLGTILVEEKGRMKCMFYEITQVWLNGLKIWNYHWIPLEKLIWMEYLNVWKVDFYFSSKFIKTKMEE